MRCLIGSQCSSRRSSVALAEHGFWNIHIERAEDADIARLHDILQSFDCVQQVTLTPIHRSGGSWNPWPRGHEIRTGPSRHDSWCTRHHLRSQCRKLVFSTLHRAKHWHQTRGEKLVKSQYGQFLCCTAWVRAMFGQASCNLSRRLLWTLRQCADKVSRPGLFVPVKRVTLRCQRLALWMYDECRPSVTLYSLDWSLALPNLVSLISQRPLLIRLF